ncbi:MAG: hypothetical protein EON60_06460 [Alphaproteobacteria bacterium]|nr:MAG: hypothetical protein EON60_06460 [Alphaproteobacteria bacterium]
MRHFILAAFLGLIATPTLADMDGPCNAFRGAGIVTGFQAGSYSLKGPDVNAQVRVTQNKDGTYTFAAHPHKGVLTLYRNGKLNVLRTRDSKTGRCVFALATRKGNNLTVYSAFRTSMSVSSRYGMPKSMPIEALPFKSRAQNAALFKDMAAHVRSKNILFTAKPATEGSLR